MQGKIIKGVGGFYYVSDGHGRVFSCRARGVFRNRNEKPLVGDDVEFDVIEEDACEGNIVRILPRKNALIRPAVANVSQAMLVFAMRFPDPNYNLVDRLLIMMRRQDLPVILIFNKCDLAGEEEMSACRKIYEKAGYPLRFISTKEERGTEELRSLLHGRTTVFAGPSGVGKSSLLNLILPEAAMATGEISRKIRRGRHTTRHSELFYLEDETFLMDTPGFTSLSVFAGEAAQIKDCYPEFEAVKERCRFLDCVHVGERDCGVKAAVEEGEISPVRYANYLQIYQEVKNRKIY